MFPLEKYVYVVKGNIITALQTYAGRVYTGVAHCAPEDEFNFETGKKLAAARCNEKIAHARFKYAQKKFKEACALKEKALKQYEKYYKFMEDATEIWQNSVYHTMEVEENLGVEFNGVEK